MYMQQAEMGIETDEDAAVTMPALLSEARKGCGSSHTVGKQQQGEESAVSFTSSSSSNTKNNSTANKKAKS